MYSDPYVTASSSATSWHDQAIETVVRAQGTDALLAVVSLYLRFRQDPNPTYSSLLRYDEFQELYQAMLPSWVEKCGASFKIPQPPLLLPQLFSLIRTLHQMDPSPMSNFVLRSESALLEVGKTRWTHMARKPPNPPPSAQTEPKRD